MVSFQKPREITAAVEVDFGAGPYERVDIRYGEDPVKLARQFCQDKGFSQTIMMPLAVKLAQALDKAKRQAADIAKTGPKVAHSKINSARQKAKAEEERRQKEEMAAKLFKRLDQNGDGDVSIAELQEALLKSSETVRILGLTSIIVFDPKTDKMVVQRKELTEFLQRWDKDGNGVLSKAEFSRMFQLKDKPKGKKYSAFSSTNYREYDRDKMEEEEARQLQRERFALRKYGKDGLILDDWVKHVTSKPKKFIFGAGPGKRKEFEEDIQKLREKNKERYPDEIQPPGQVFDKLYTKAMEKKEREREIEKQKEESEKIAAQAAKTARKSVMSKVSRELMRNRTAGEYSTYNERLYAEASQRTEARKEMARRAREEREREELREVTMQPEISAYAKHLKRPEAAWEKLGDGTKVREKYGKLAEIKMEMEKKELRDCTFRPKINAKSKEMMRGRLDNLRDRGLNHHDQLYFDANRRQMRQEEYEAWKAQEHTFHPNAHRVVEELAAGGDGGDSENNPGPGPFHAPAVNHDRVVQRLQASAVRSEQHRERLADEMYGKLGKPQTGRAPQFPRNPANMPIHDLLYANRSEFDDKRELLRMRDDERLKEEASAVLKSERSRDLAAALRRRKLRRIFRALDSDGRGAIDLSALVKAGGWEQRLLKMGGGDSPGKHGELSKEHSVDSVSHGSHGSLGGGGRGGTRDEVSEHDLKQMKEDVEATSAKLGDAPVDVEKFVEGMEAHLAKTRTGPRAYLAQKSGYRALKAEQAVAAAELAEKKGADDAKVGVSLERTKKLAEARQRKLGWDKNTPYYEKLIAEGQRSKQKLEQLAAEIEADQMSKYTFQPETLKFKMPGGLTPRPRSARVSDAYSAGNPMRPPDQERTGEERYADLERELEAVLALGEGRGGGSAEELLAALGPDGSIGGASPSPRGRLPQLESSDSEEEEEEEEEE